jgi:hypothetical protein
MTMYAIRFATTLPRPTTTTLRILIVESSSTTKATGRSRDRKDMRGGPPCDFLLR